MLLNKVHEHFSSCKSLWGYIMVCNSKICNQTIRLYLYFCGAEVNFVQLI